METPEGIARHLAEVVSVALRGAGLSQRDVAAATGIPLVTLNRRLTGRSPMTIAELAAIAGVCGVGVTELVLRAERATATSAA